MTRTDGEGPASGASTGGLLGRASWNLVDQVLSSGTNAVLSFLVARSVSETAFGGFSVAFTVFAILVGLSRGLATSPMGIRFADASPAEFDESAGRAAGTALVLGALGGAACLLVGAVLPGDVRPALLALGVVLPGLLVQDAWRYVFFAAGRPAAAALNDAVWAVIQLGSVAALLLAGVPAVGPLVLAWGLSAAAAALLGVRQARTRPRPGSSRRWLREHRDLTGYLVAEFATQQGGQQGALLVIAAVSALETIGALRGVQVLLGPTTILVVATLAFAVPELARRRDAMTPRRWTRAAAGIGAVVAVLGFAWGLLFVLLPDVVGSTLLGPTWPGVQEVLWPTIIGQVGASLGVGPVVALYAMDRAPVTFSVHLVEAPLMFVLGVVGVFVAGAYGAAWGLGLPFWLALPLWWIKLRRELRRHEAADVAPSA